MNNLSVRIFNNNGQLPSYETAKAAGCDISSREAVTIEPGKWALVGTGLHVEIPDGYELQIRPRSGHAAKKGVTVLNTPGTVDSDYRGEVKVILANLGEEPFTVTPGMRVAQGILAKVYRGEFTEVASLEELSQTDRGHGGFGHTGH